jgi:phosphohistidine phosphatase
MEIYLLRHGIAEEAKRGVADPARALTEAGRQKLRRVLERAAVAGVQPSLIVTSPYRRAQETAEVAKQILGCNRIEESEALTPDSAPADVWKLLRAHRDENAVLLASHEPLMGMTLGYLLGAPGMRVDFKKAGLASVGMESLNGAPHGVMQWMLVPRLV